MGKKHRLKKHKRACRILDENFGEVRRFVVKIKPKCSKATKPNERKATKNSVPKEGLLLLPSQQLQLVLLLLLLLLLPEEGGGAGGQGWWGVQKGILRVVAFISHFWHFFSLVGWINWISVLSEVWKGAEKRGVGWLVGCQRHNLSSYPTQTRSVCPIDKLAAVFPRKTEGRWIREGREKVSYSKFLHIMVSHSLSPGQNFPLLQEKKKVK